MTSRLRAIRCAIMSSGDQGRGGSGGSGLGGGGLLTACGMIFSRNSAINIDSVDCQLGNDACPGGLIGGIRAGETCEGRMRW